MQAGVWMTQRSEIHRQEAQAAAKACIRLLQEEYGARRVVPFGSLVGEMTWHARSDIDLAVEGLDPALLFSAFAACRALLPPGLELDLVPLENVYPEMRARILQEIPMPDDPIQTLRVLIEDELTALERVSQEMSDLLAARAEPPTRVELRAMASILHEFYNGVERILERLALEFDGVLPGGSAWHTDLLDQMALAQGGERSAVIDSGLHARLKDLLAFRHFYRHAYGYTLRWEQMQDKAEGLGRLLENLRGQIQRLFDT